MQAQLRDMAYFAAIAEHGQVQRAAAALGLSQPALSKGLRRLEQAMNARLVKRTPKGIELTSAGSALLAQIRRLRLSLDDITREISDLSLGRAGHLRVGIAPSFASDLVPNACAALLQEAPRVTFKVTVLEREASLSALRRGELDLALTALPVPRDDGLVEEHLIEDKYVVYASANHRLAGKKRVTLADLARERWAVLAFNTPTPERIGQVFADAGLPRPEIAMESNSPALRHRLLASSNLVGFAPQRVVREATPRAHFAELHVKDLTYTRRAGVIYRKDAYLSPAAKRFIEILKRIASEIAKENR